jgi:hypothetical protein
MTKYESKIKAVPFAKEKIFKFLSDFDHFGELVPQDKIKNWQSYGDHCTFEIDLVGKVGLRIVESTPFDTIKYTSEGSTSVNFQYLSCRTPVNNQLYRIRLPHFSHI